MNDEHRRETEDLSADAARFVERLKAAYEPTPMNAARRAALDARVRERIDHPPRQRWLAPAAAFAVVAVAFVFWARTDHRDEPAPAPVVARVEAPDTQSWEAQLYLYDASTGSDAIDGTEDELLPADYAAIDRLFFDG